MHSLATPPSPPPMMAAELLLPDSFKEELTKVDEYNFSSLSATCSSLSINKALPNSFNFNISINWPCLDLKVLINSSTT